MEEKDVHKAMWWAQQSGCFSQQQQIEFHEIVRMLQAKAISPQNVVSGMKIDEGSFGSIETAFYHGSRVAIKYVKPASAIGGGIPQTLHLLKLELAIVQTLRHPNIVDFIGAVCSFPGPNEKLSDWNVGTMFEFCDGGQLNKLLHTKKVKYPLVKKFSIMTDLANGLSYLHGQRVIHRDLGSRNILIKGARAKICDFGCARRLMGNSYTSSTISGSPPWMSPEQILGKDLTLKADVFSYGIIVWEIATEQVPYGNLQNPTIETFKEAILSERLEPTMPTQEHMSDCPYQIRQDLTRLLTLLRQPIADLRPTAEQARCIMTKIAKGVCPHIDTPLGDVETLLLQLEDRMELGKRAAEFYMKYNPSKLKDLPKVLDNFMGKEDELNEQMRMRYKADLNGEYTDPDPEIEPEEIDQQPVIAEEVSLARSGSPSEIFKENQRHDANRIKPPSASSTPVKFGVVPMVQALTPGRGSDSREASSSKMDDS